MTTTPKPSTSRPQVVDNPDDEDIVFGSGVRLRPLDQIARELAHLGVSRRALYHLLRALNIPKIQSGTKWYINPFWLQVAVHAISRPGAKDFLFPGSEEGRKGTHIKQGRARTLPIEHFEEHMKLFIAEMVMARRTKHGTNPANYIKSISIIAEQISHQYDMLRAPLAYERSSERAIKQAHNRYATTLAPGSQEENPVPSHPSSDAISPFYTPVEGHEPPTP